MSRSIGPLSFFEIVTFYFSQHILKSIFDDFSFFFSPVSMSNSLIKASGKFNVALK